VCRLSLSNLQVFYFHIQTIERTVDLKEQLENDLYKKVKVTFRDLSFTKNEIEVDLF